MSASTTTRPTPTNLGRLALVGLAAGAAAAVVNLIIYFIGGALGIVFEAQMGPGAPITPIPAVAFVMAGLIPGLIGGLFYALLGRFSGRATTIFVGVAIAFALLSLLSPLTLPVALSTRLALACLHLITAAIITWGLVRYS